jgi:hypothetical protein
LERERPDAGSADVLVRNLAGNGRRLSRKVIESNSRFALNADEDVRAPGIRHSKPTFRAELVQDKAETAEDAGVPAEASGENGKHATV